MCINLADSTCAEKGDGSDEFIHFHSDHVKCIEPSAAVTSPVRTFEMFIGDEVDSHEFFPDFDSGIFLNGFKECSLYFAAG